MTVDNFKFKELIECSGFSIAEKHDILTIFNCLSDDRKIDIINQWPRYLNEIFKIRQESTEKRRDNISKALRNIDELVNEAILRKKQAEENDRIKRKEDSEILRGAQSFDEMRRAQMLKNLINKNHDNG